MSQSKIDVEADAGQLLRKMGTRSWNMIFVDPGDAAAQWLVRRGYFYRVGYGHGERIGYASTIEGREYYESLCRNPSVTESPRAWVEEARSQLAMKAGPVGTVTRESTISRACIPGPSPPRTPRSPEDMVADMERDMAAQIRWCERLGVSPDELRELGQEGRIRFCAGCESVGVFDRDRGGWKSKCRKCRKDGRR